MSTNIQIQSIIGPDKIFFGVNKETNEEIYLSKPSFDCNWYWSFGYLGNSDCHYQLDSYQSKQKILYTKDGKLTIITEKRNISMYDALLADYTLNPIIEKNLWVFCELALSIYTLKKAAELFHIGGAHMTVNPGKDKLKNIELYNTLTFDLIPEQCQLLWDLINK